MFIEKGYRVNYSWKMCIKSIFRAHNETVNVWTHFIGVLIFAGLMIHTIYFVADETTIPTFPSSNLTLQHTFLDMAQKLYSEGLAPSAQPPQRPPNNADPHSPHPLLLSFSFCPASNDTTPFSPHFPIEFTSYAAFSSPSSSSSSPFSSNHTLDHMEHAVRGKVAELKQFLSECRDKMERKIHEMDIYLKEIEKSVHEFSNNTNATTVAELLSERLGEMQENFNEKVAKYFSPKSKFPIMVFLFSAMVCFMGSTLYHTFGCQSHWHSSFFLKIDYSGISTLIAGSLVPFVWYTFHGLTHWQCFYLATLFVLSCLVMYVSFSERFASNEYKPYRVLCFVLLAAFAIVPFIHMLYLYGTVELYSFQRCALSAILYLLGVAAYMSRVPERLFPGRCDFLLQSHQVFHTFIVAAALVWYSFALRLLVSRTYVN